MPAARQSLCGMMGHHRWDHTQSLTPDRPVVAEIQRLTCGDLNLGSLSRFGPKFIYEHTAVVYGTGDVLYGTGTVTYTTQSEIGTAPVETGLI